MKAHITCSRWYKRKGDTKMIRIKNEICFFRKNIVPLSSLTH